MEQIKIGVNMCKLGNVAGCHFEGADTRDIDNVLL